MQVSRLERVLKEEKAGRERQVAELEAYAAQLEDELELEHRRRLNEQLCALIEGAPFIMYKSSEVSERHVWFRYRTPPPPPAPPKHTPCPQLAACLPPSIFVFGGCFAYSLLCSGHAYTAKCCPCMCDMPYAFS